MRLSFLVSFLYVTTFYLLWSQVNEQWQLYSLVHNIEKLQNTMH